MQDSINLLMQSINSNDTQVTLDSSGHSNQNDLKSQENDDLRKQISFHQQQVHDTQLVIQQLKDVIFQMNSREHQLIQEKQELETQNLRYEKLSIKIEEIKHHDNQKYQNKLDELEKQIILLNQNNETIEDINNKSIKLQEDLEIANSQVFMLQTEIDNQKKSINSQSRRNTINQEELAQKMQSLQNGATSQRSKDNDPNTNNNNSNEISEELQQYKQQVLKLERKLQKSQVYEDQVQVLSAELEDKIVQISELRLLSRSQDSSRVKLDEVIKQNGSLQAELNHSKQQTDLEKEALQKQILRHEKLNIKIEEINQKDKQQFQNKVDELENDIIKLKQNDDKQKNNNKMIHLQEDLDTANSQIYLLQTEIDNYKKNLNSQNRRNTINQEDLMKQMQMLQGKDPGASEKNTTDFQQDIQEYQDQIEKLQRKLKKALVYKEQVQVISVETDNKQLQIQELILQKKSQNDKLESLQSRFDQLIRQTGILEAEQIQLKNKVKETKIQTDQEREVLQKQILRHEKLNIKMEEINQKDKQQFQNKVDELEEQIMRLKQNDEIEKNANKMIHLQEDLEIANSQIYLLQTEIDNYKKNLNSQNRRNTINQEDLFQQMQKLQDRDKDPNTKGKNGSENQEDIEEYKEKVEKLQRKLKKALVYKEQVTKLSLELENKMTKIEDQQQLSSPHDQVVTKLQDTLKGKLDEAICHNSLIQTELNQLKAQVQITQSQTAKEKEGLEKQILRHAKLNIKIEEINKKEKLQFSNQVDDLEKEIMLLRQNESIYKNNDQTISLQEDLETANSQIYLLQTEIDNHKKNLNSQNRRNTINQEDILKQMQMLQGKDKVQDTSARNRADTQEDIQEYKDQIEKLQRKLKKAQVYKDQVQVISVESDNKQLQIQEMILQKKSQNDKLESLQSRFDQLTHRIGILEAEQIQLKNKVRETKIQTDQEREVLQKQILRHEKLNIKMEEINQKDKQQFQNKVDELEEQIMRLKQNDEIEKNANKMIHLKEDLEIANSQIYLLQTEIDNYKKNLNSQNRRNTINQEDLFQQMQKLQDRDKDPNTKGKNGSVNQEDIEEYKEKVEKLQRKLKKALVYKEQAQLLKSEMDNKQIQIIELQLQAKEIKDLKISIIKQQEIIQQKNHQNYETEESLIHSFLQQKVQDKSLKNLEMMSEDIKQQKAQIEVLVQKNQYEVNEKELIIASLTKQNINLECIIDKLREQINDLRSKSSMPDNRQANSSVDNTQPTALAEVDQYKQREDNKSQKDKLFQILCVNDNTDESKLQQKDQSIQLLQKQIQGYESMMSNSKQNKYQQEELHNDLLLQLEVSNIHLKQSQDSLQIQLEDQTSLRKNSQIQFQVLQNAMQLFKTSIQPQLDRYENVIQSLQIQLQNSNVTASKIARENNSNHNELKFQLIEKDKLVQFLNSQVNKLQSDINGSMKKSNYYSDNSGPQQSSYRSESDEKYNKFDELQNDISRIKINQNLLYHKFNTDLFNIENTVTSNSPGQRQKHQIPYSNISTSPYNLSNQSPIKSSQGSKQNNQNQKSAQIDEIYQSCLEQSKNMLQKHYRQGQNNFKQSSIKIVEEQQIFRSQSPNKKTFISPLVNAKQNKDSMYELKFVSNQRTYD